MFTTTLAAVTLTGLLSPAANLAPTWQADYGKALALAAEQQKPVAVVIASGNAGLFTLTAGKTADVLRDRFVAVYVNTETADGKALAGQFQLAEGLVISNKGGSLQALRHDGKVTGEQLKGYLNTYADAPAAVESTQYVGHTGGSACAGGACATGTCYTGACYTGGCSTGYYGGGYVGGCSTGSCGSWTGGCSTGHCGGGWASSCGSSGCGGGRGGFFGGRGGRGCR